MPVESNVEFGNGRLYIKGLDEPLEIYEGEATYETEYADDQEPYIKISQEPVTFTLDSFAFPRGWVLTKCKECGYEFPITELYSLLYGTKGWSCPRCTFIKRLEDARKRSNE